MDKKNTIIGAALFLAAFGILIYSQKYAPKRPEPAEIQRGTEKQIAAGSATAAAQGSPALAGPAATAGTDELTFTSAQADRNGATVTKLGNSFVEVSFTDAGGAIRTVAFKKYPAALGRPDPFIFNELHVSPMLAFAGLPGLEHTAHYALVSQSESEITYRAVAGQIEVTRHYVVSPDKGAATDPYVIRCETTFRNLGDTPSAPARLAFSIGTAAPNNAIDTGLQLTTEYSNGKDQVKVLRSALEASNGILGYNAHEAKPVITSGGPVAWATVKNQFFAAILTPDDPAAGLETRRVKLLEALPDTDRNAYGITATVDVDLAPVSAHAQQTLAGNFYVGPKEYPRLSNADVFKHDEDRVMDFGNYVFRFCAAILLTVMTKIHSWVGNWGVAIVLTTLSLKILFTPITLAQSRTSRRTQRVMPELKLIKEKFKDNAQKQQQATMELYKKHKINPVAGCIPMLLTIPFFWGFFTMLRSAAELRFAPFLWAHDLSAPDTIAVLTLPVIGVLNVNVFPILLGAVNFFQMRVTPQPSVDNAQMKLMKFMPIMFVLFYYSWPCALSVYSTVNGLYTIFQQLIVNRTKDLEDTAPVRTGKPTKNVTPRKR
ncbi:MAG TPA: membrane protein insertase YidC [Opitutaceae bacterium]